MLAVAVAAVAPALAQGGSHYVRRIDRLLLGSTNDAGDTSSSSSGGGGTTDYPSSPPSLLTMARVASSFRDAIILPPDASFGDDGGHSSRVVDMPATTPDEVIPHHHLLTPRERWHLHALQQLLQNNHRDAMGAYLRLLELYPGDLLGLSLALDVAYALGDSPTAWATYLSSFFLPSSWTTMRRRPRQAHRRRQRSMGGGRGKTTTVRYS
ncbi:hypothetical protein ACHAW5_009686 [Stephanodiscus triporus]|uniref:Tetratricopeptide repeat protein 38 n=1 Tax=Stephanodiscus triporus TaxID=2934178 RepID=A0ABD3NS60_9STRA